MIDDDDDCEMGEVGGGFCDCTCEHRPEDHGYGACNIEGCECEGGWEEEY